VQQNVLRANIPDFNLEFEHFTGMNDLLGRKKLYVNMGS
jgi:hypothetical protein